MRVADKINTLQINKHLSQNRSEMNDLQSQIATMKRVTKPSDDPVAATRVLSARTDLAATEQFERNLLNAQSFLNFSEQSLSELNDLIVRVKELAVGQANTASANPITRKAVAKEVQQILNQVVMIGNRKLGDRYLFGGFKTQTPPFDSIGRYNGDEGEMLIEVNKGAFVSMNVPGNRIFLGEGVGKEKDPKLQLETESEKMERLDREEKIKEVVQGPDMRGPASIDGKEEKQGDNSSMPRVSGDLRNDQGTNIFQTIRRLAIGLQSNDDKVIQDSLEVLDSNIDQVVLARAEMGARLTTLDGALQSLRNSQVDAKTLTSQFEDADLFQLVNDLGKKENVLKATLNSSAKIVDRSLLDFLR